MLQKLHLKEFFQKLTEGIGDLIGNKTAEEVTSADKTKTKGKEKKDETNEIQELFIHPEKCQKILML